MVGAFARGRKVVANMQVKVKEYRSRREFEGDARKMGRSGWIVQAVAVVPGHTLVGHTLLKWITGVGVLTGPVRTADITTVTYTKP